MPQDLDSFGRALTRRHELRANAELENDLAAFFCAAWKTIEPETQLIWSWHYDCICEWLEMVSRGEFKQRYPDKLGLIFNIPPRCAKSSLITVAWPVWTWLQFPAKRFLCASYADKLAADHSIRRRNLIASRWFQERFGSRFTLQGDRNRIDFFENDRTGYCMATSVGASGTGFGGDYLIGDDLLNAEDAFSEAARTATNRWIDATFATRLNSPSTGVFLYVSQRLHQDDPTGHLLEAQKDAWIHIKIPLEAEEDERYVFPVSGRVVERTAGDVLQPQRFTASVVENLKRNSREWNGQYLQSPTIEQGGIIKRIWWKFYVRPGDPRPEGCLVLPDQFEEMAQSWDLSFKDSKTSDYVCGGVWGRVGAMKYLLDIFWERADFVATKKAVISMTARWPDAYAKWVEDKANGPAILAELKTEISGLISVEPQGSKEARLHAAAPDVESGNVVLPHPSVAPWVRRFIDECAAACCGGKHDDAADMLSQAINKFRQSSNYYGFAEWCRLKAQGLPIPGANPELAERSRARDDQLFAYGGRIVEFFGLNMARRSRYG